jgi:hypothetical protein
MYNKNIERRCEKMGKGNKNGNQDTPQKLILITAIVNLIAALVALLQKLTE